MYVLAVFGEFVGLGGIGTLSLGILRIIVSKGKFD